MNLVLRSELDDYFQFSTNHFKLIDYLMEWKPVQIIQFWRFVCRYVDTRPSYCSVLAGINKVSFVFVASCWQRYEFKDKPSQEDDTVAGVAVRRFWTIEPRLIGSSGPGGHFQLKVLNMWNFETSSFTSHTADLHKTEIL